MYTKNYTDKHTNKCLPNNTTVQLSDRTVVQLYSCTNVKMRYSPVNGQAIITARIADNLG